MSKKSFAVLSLSLLTLAACNAPADISDDALINDDLPPVEDVYLDDFFIDEELSADQESSSEVLILDEEAVIESDVEAEADIDLVQ